MEGIVSSERPSNYRRLLGAIEKIVLTEEDEPRMTCMIRFPSIFGGGEERVEVPGVLLEAAGIDLEEGERFFAWANLEAESPEEVQPIDFEAVRPEVKLAVKQSLESGGL